MDQYLEILLNDISNKEIPILCFEIMSCFYKEDTIIKYIEILGNMLVKAIEEQETVHIIKIIKILKSLSVDKFGAPIFKNQKRVFLF